MYNMFKLPVVEKAALKGEESRVPTENNKAHKTNMRSLRKEKIQKKTE
jgi:hypothetical protein